MKINYSPIKDLDRLIYKQLYSLNFRSAGYMRLALQQSRNNTNQYIKDAYVAYVTDDDNKVRGWSLIFTTNIPHVVSERVQHLYVKHAERGKGIGTALVKYVSKVNENLHAHIDESTCFRRAKLLSVNRRYLYYL